MYALGARIIHGDFLPCAGRIPRRAEAGHIAIGELDAGEAHQTGGVITIGERLGIRCGDGSDHPLATSPRPGHVGAAPLGITDGGVAPQPAPVASQ